MKNRIDMYNSIVAHVVLYQGRTEYRDETVALLHDHTMIYNEMMQSINV
jgi:hypothetical protein